jgi:membrane protease subunit (stomatin/prohibitin family)
MALIDRIKYDAPNDDAIVWKYPHDTIRLGAQLIVNESQEAVFFKGGQALDTFGPGTHTLATGNLPILDRIVSLPFGGQTPFSAEIWYVNRTVRRGLKWGTKGPLQLIDRTFNYPVSVRAFGQWGIRIDDSRSFLTQLVGTQSSTSSGRSSAAETYFGVERIEGYFGSTIVQRLSDALSRYFTERGISVFEASSRLNELSSFVAADIKPEFDRFGIEIVNFNVERVSIPDEDQKRFQEILGRRMDVEQLSQSQIGPAYNTIRTFDTLEKAASNEGGAVGQLFGGGLGLGIGAAAGAQIGHQRGGVINAGANTDTNDPVVKLAIIKRMFDQQLISEEEFNQKKHEILSTI